MFSQVLYITIPVFGIAAVGYLFGRLSQINMDAINKANMDLFVPLLLFYLLTEKPFAMPLSYPPSRIFFTWGAATSGGIRPRAVRLPEADLVDKRHSGRSATYL